MKQKTPLLRKSGVQTLLSSLLCIVLGLLVGYLALLIIEPSGAWGAIVGVLKNFMKYPSAAARLKYFGNTLVKTAPLLLCSLSVLFAYKVGLFNIGAAGQYVIGAAAALYCALMPGLPWYVCLLAAVAAAALSGAICGALRAYCNVNVVISGIMLNWISLYATNLILKPGMDPTGKDTYRLIKLGHTDSILPTLGLDELFSKNQYVTIAIPIAIIVAIIVWVVLSMLIAGALAGLGAGLYFLSDFEQWNVNSSSVPAMGFNGIAAAFLGGLHPIGAIFSSLFIQHITLGGGNVDLSHYCAQIADFISSVIIYLCGFVLFFKAFMNRIMDKREEKRLHKAALAAENKEGGDK